MNYSFLDSGDISVEEFIAFINSNVPQGAYGLKSLFSTIGMREEIVVFLSSFYDSFFFKFRY